MIRLTLLLLIVALFTPLIAQRHAMPVIAPKATAANTPQVQARAAILIDRYTGVTLWEHNANLPLPMASTTKIMTAMVILDHGANTLNDNVTVSQHAASTGGSSVFGAGDVVSLYNLLRAALLRSSNEATVAAAEYLGGAGGEAQFVRWMNEKAAALHLKHTHFANPHGLYAPDHHTTARELALMARMALTYPVIRKILQISTEYITVPPSGRKVCLENHNKIIGQQVPGIPGAVVDGVKTGFVREAGQCYVSSATVKGWQLIAVVLNSSDKFGEGRGLLSYGFSHYAWKTYATAEQRAAVAPVTGSKLHAIAVGTQGVLGAPVRRAEYGGSGSDALVFQQSPGGLLRAPVQRGQVIGTLQVVRNGRIITELPAIALQEAPRVWWWGAVQWGWRALLAVFVLLLAGKMYGTIAKSSRRRRRKLEAASRKTHYGRPGDRQR